MPDGENTRPAYRSLGVLGGMGPLAGALFAQRLVQLTQAEVDQQHIPVLLRNDPRIPDRSHAFMHGGESPLPAMQAGIAALEKAGVDCIAIPCNTAHLWFDELQARSRVPLLHIVDAAIADLRRHGLTDGPVGIMGTDATLATGMYQKALEEAGFTALVLDEQDHADFSVRAITLVKGNQLAAAYAPAREGVLRLQQQGAIAVVLGCTELPLALPPASRPPIGITLLDSIDALARQALAWFGRNECQPCPIQGASEAVRRLA